MIKMNKDYPGYTDEEVIEGLKNTNRILSKMLDERERSNRLSWFQWFTSGIIFGILIGLAL